MRAFVTLFCLFTPPIGWLVLIYLVGVWEKEDKAIEAEKAEKQRAIESGEATWNEQAGEAFGKIVATVAMMIAVVFLLAFIGMVMSV